MAGNGQGWVQKAVLTLLPLVTVAIVTLILTVAKVQENRDDIADKADRAVVEQQFKTVDTKLDEVLRRLERIERNQ